MDLSAFSNYLTDQLKKNIQIESAHSVSGGDIHQAYQLQTNIGNLFLKLNNEEAQPLFATEARSLHAINQSHSIRSPKALGHGIFANQAWLLMEYLPLTSQGDDLQRGYDLAKMHQHINQAPQPFGWFEDNFIGHTLQKNQWHFSWVDFYANQRLLPQLELSQINGAQRSLYDYGLELITALPYWFENYQPQASLLHGDLWAGNSAFIKQEPLNQAVIYDPASYYGDRETDLAMSELFGGFSPAFYQGYNQLYPIDKGYQKRKPLYNLYHLLNHYNLFGGHYQSQALRTIQQLLQQAN